MRSSDFRDSTRMQVITGGAAQANQILADFKGSKPRKSAKAAPSPAPCGCGGPTHK